MKIAQAFPGYCVQLVNTVLEVHGERVRGKLLKKKKAQKFRKIQYGKKEQQIWSCPPKIRKLGDCDSQSSLRLTHTHHSKSLESLCFGRQAEMLGLIVTAFIQKQHSLRDTGQVSTVQEEESLKGPHVLVHLHCLDFRLA